MSEEPPHRERSPRNILFALIISVVVATSGAIIFIEYDNIMNENNILREDYPLGNYECEGWIEEGRLLVRKYHPQDDINHWLPEDQIKIFNLENQVLYHCTKQRVDVMDNLPLCIPTYETIQRLLDQMVEMEVNSLSESDQELYQSNYDIYFKNGCDLLQVDIDETLAGLK